jgi:hypothetical protein
MWEDPIVADIHRVREQLAAEHDFDVKAIFAELRRRQAALGERLVRQKRRGEINVEAPPRSATPRG